MFFSPRESVSNVTFSIFCPFDVFCVHCVCSVCCDSCIFFLFLFMVFDLCFTSISCDIMRRRTHFPSVLLLFGSRVLCLFLSLLCSLVTVLHCCLTTLILLHYCITLRPFRLNYILTSCEYFITPYLLFSFLTKSQPSRQSHLDLSDTYSVILLVV